MFEVAQNTSGVSIGLMFFDFGKYWFKVLGRIANRVIGVVESD